MTVIQRAAFVAIGSELLTPLRLDTNSLFVTELLNAIGVRVVIKSVVGDDPTELAEVLALALARADLVICCGGLGPTDDDVTREVVSRALGQPLRESAAITERLRERFAARSLGAMPEINRRQAMVPEGAQVLENGRGSAPGLWIEADGRYVVLLPGPPRELQPMMEAVVAQRLRALTGGAVVTRRVIKITGRIESQTEELLQPLYEAWRGWVPAVEATILAKLGQLELYLTVRSPDEAHARSSLDRAATSVATLLGDDVFSLDGTSLEGVVGQLLEARGEQIAVAESCTGGLVASRLTDVAGSSTYVERGIVAYSNRAKIELLGVSEVVLAEHGAVSEPVGCAMAEGIRTRSGATIGIGVTGIAGPGGGSTTKPVGTVVVAVAHHGAVRAQTFRFSGERDQVKFQASQAALDMVRRVLVRG